MSPARTDPSAAAEPAHERVATWLAGRLIVVFAVTVAISAVVSPPDSAIDVAVLVLAGGFAIWFAVHHVFEALDALLEEKGR